MNRPRKWTAERVNDIARLFQTRAEFRKNAPRAYSAAARYGWLNAVCSHMDPTGTDWTFEKCLAAAQKYNCESAFKIGSNPAYQSAYRKGWLDRICVHMA